MSCAAGDCREPCSPCHCSLLAHCEGDSPSDMHNSRISFRTKYGKIQIYVHSGTLKRCLCHCRFDNRNSRVLSMVETSPPKTKCHFCARPKRSSFVPDTESKWQLISVAHRTMVVLCNSPHQSLIFRTCTKKLEKFSHHNDVNVKISNEAKEGC